MWYNVKNIDDIDTPALLLYKERVQENIIRAITMVSQVGQLRPHVKTHKIREVVAMQQREGINKFKCATIAEAEMLGMQDAADVIIAYPVVGPRLKRIKALREKFTNTTYSCLIDNEKSANELSECFINNPLQVYIDLNVGMDRTGITTDKALELFKNCSHLKGIDIVGLHAYDGHIHDTDISIRTSRADDVFNFITVLQKQIENFSAKTMRLVMAGSPTFKIYAAKNKNIEVSPGTFVFWDEGYSNILPDLNFLIAAVLVTRVIAIIDSKTICLDVGHKSVAAENPLPRIKFLNVNNAKPIGQNEEHMIVEVKDSSNYAVGDVWYGVPIHICPTVALYTEVMVVQNEMVTGKWNVIAKGRSISI
jgi:D-threonine aldolase